MPRPRIKGAVKWCTHKKRRATYVRTSPHYLPCIVHNQLHDFMILHDSVRKDKYNPTDHEYLVDVSSKKTLAKESEDKLVDDTDLGEHERENVAFGFDSDSQGPNSEAESCDDASSASSEPARKKNKSKKKRTRASSTTPSPKKPKNKPGRGGFVQSRSRAAGCYGGP